MWKLRTFDHQSINTKAAAVSHEIVQRIYILLIELRAESDKLLKIITACFLSGAVLLPFSTVQKVQVMKSYMFTSGNLYTLIPILGSDYPWLTGCTVHRLYYV